MARYGDVLSVVGRGEEGQKYIDDALKLADEVKDESSTSEALNDLGDSYFYRGDYSSARQQYERARQVAGKWALPDQGLRARLGLARVDLEQGRAKAAAPALKKIMQDEALSMGLKALAVQASISYAQALLATDNADAARQELESALGPIDKMGMLLERARAEYLLGNALTRTGKPKEAPLHYREADRDFGLHHQQGKKRSSYPGAPRSQEHVQRGQVVSGRCRVTRLLTFSNQTLSPTADLHPGWSDLYFAAFSSRTART